MTEMYWKNLATNSHIWNVCEMYANPGQTLFGNEEKISKNPKISVESETSRKENREIFHFQTLENRTCVWQSSMNKRERVSQSSKSILIHCNCLLITLISNSDREVGDDLVIYTRLSVYESTQSIDQLKLHSVEIVEKRFKSSKVDIRSRMIWSWVGSKCLPRLRLQ